jgi:hypothetical protein
MDDQAHQHRGIKNRARNAPLFFTREVKDNQISAFLYFLSASADIFRNPLAGCDHLFHLFNHDPALLGREQKKRVERFFVFVDDAHGGGLLYCFLHPTKGRLKEE